MKKKVLFTSESVSEGHPDKVCDQIADAILDECLAQDPSSHCAIEVFATTEYILIGGEVTTKGHIDYEGIARRVLKDIGYIKPEDGISIDCKIDVRVKEQSIDIANGIKNEDPLQLGAGDQGFVFGYATNETEGYMPLAISIAHKLVRTASELRKKGLFKMARPDMKSQVTIDYSDPKHLKIDTILMSIQHNEDVSQEELREFVKEKIILPVVRSFGFNEDFKLLINPSGRFVIGGPLGDTGLTGRKLVVDTYGGSCRHGGGSFSGKDPSKVDRSGALYGRYIAKNLVASGAADHLEVQIAYAIGVPEPISISVDCGGTNHYAKEDIIEAIETYFDARPGAIIKAFSLTKPEGFSYHLTSNYGCFGRPDLPLPWERLDKVDSLKSFFETKNKIA